jgi:hypothetical protein
LTACEKEKLKPYIDSIDLNKADIHDYMPWWVKSSAAGYTDGNDIYFQPGAYSPATVDGFALLGHELVHVGQYRGGMTALDYSLEWLSHGSGIANKYEAPAYAMQDKIRLDLKETCGCK